MKRVTIADVASHVGVSPTAVSFAFNNPAQLSPATVERIRAAAHMLGYAPNPHARALLSRRTGVVAVLVPQSIYAIFANPFFSSYLQGVGGVCDERDLALLILSPVDGSIGDAIVRAPVDGFIIVGLDERHTEVAPLRKRRVPFVIVDGQAELAPQVTIDDEGGAHAAAAHLLGRGHRDILIVSLERPFGVTEGDQFVGSQRLCGYRRAFTDVGVAWRPAWVVSSLSSIDDGEQTFDAAWSAGLRPSAVLAMSDAAAIGILRGAARHGLRLPDDLEVIGFDDVPLAALVTPALSTVHQPIVERGRTATELLCAMLDGATAPESVHLPTNLVLRSTTRV